MITRLPATEASSEDHQESGLVREDALQSICRVCAPSRQLFVLMFDRLCVLRAPHFTFLSERSKLIENRDFLVQPN
jgi:hypothetical protein